MALKDLFGKKSLKTIPSKNLNQVKEGGWTSLATFSQHCEAAI